MPNVLLENHFANGYYKINTLNDFFNSDTSSEESCDMTFNKVRIIDFFEENKKIFIASFPEDESVYSGYIRLELLNDGQIKGNAFYDSNSNWKANKIEGTYVIHSETLFMFLKWETIKANLEQICLEVPLPNKLKFTCQQNYTVAEKVTFSNNECDSKDVSNLYNKNSLLEFINLRYPTAIKNSSALDFIVEWYKENNNHLLVLLPYESSMLFDFKCIGHYNVIELYLKNKYIQKFYGNIVREENYKLLVPLLIMIYSLVESKRTLISYEKYINQYTALFNYNLIKQLSE